MFPPLENSPPRQHHRGPGPRNESLVKVKLIEGEETSDEKTQPRPSHAQQTEKLQRPRRIIQQEFDDQQIQEHPDRPPDSVVGLSALAVEILDGHFRDFRAT